MTRVTLFLYLLVGSLIGAGLSFAFCECHSHPTNSRSIPPIGTPIGETRTVAIHDTTVPVTFRPVEITHLKGERVFLHDTTYVGPMSVPDVLVSNGFTFHAVREGDTVDGLANCTLGTIDLSVHRAPGQVTVQKVTERDSIHTETEISDWLTADLFAQGPITTGFAQTLAHATVGAEGLYWLGNLAIGVRPSYAIDRGASIEATVHFRVFAEEKRRNLP